MVRKEKQFPYRKILVVRFSSIGDIIMTTPVMRTIKTQYPACEVHFVTKKENESIVGGNKYIDKVFLLGTSFMGLVDVLKKEKYDLIIDLHQNIRSFKLSSSLIGFPSFMLWCFFLLVNLGFRFFNTKPTMLTFSKLNLKRMLFANDKTRWMANLPKKHLVERHFEALKKINVTYDNKGLDFFINPDVEHKLSKIVPQKSIAMIIGSSTYTRTFPVEKWEELISKLYEDKEFKHKIVLLGGKTELSSGTYLQQKFPELINLCDELSFEESSFYVERADMIITNDTGLSHVAAAFKKKILSIWGGGSIKYGHYPFGVEGVEYFQNDSMDCRPCSKNGKNICPKGHFRCMLDIDTTVMKERVMSYLGRNGIDLD